MPIEIDPKSGKATLKLHRSSSDAAPSRPGPSSGLGTKKTVSTPLRSGLVDSVRKKTKAARLAKRAESAFVHGELKGKRVSAETRRRYTAMNGLFARFILHGWVTNALPCEPERAGKVIDGCSLSELDWHLESWIEHLYHHGGSRESATYAFAAVSFHKVWQRGHDNTPRSKATLAGWSKEEPDLAAEPCPDIVAVALASWLIGIRNTIAEQVGYAVLCAQHLILRPAEVLALRAEDVILPNFKRGKITYDSTAVVVAPSSIVSEAEALARRTSKTGTQDDTVIAYRDAGVDVPEILARLSDKKGGLLFPDVTYSAMRIWLQKACVAFKLPYTVRPHMLRHGGASEAIYRKVLSLEQLKLRGRWRSSKSVARYAKSGRLLAQVKKVSDKSMLETSRHLSFLSKEVVRLGAFRG